jgi:hypothetical protein
MGKVYFHLFPYLKQFLLSTHEGTNKYEKQIVKDCFNGLAEDFYETGIQKLVT